jgi:hypothetical protein
MLVKRFGNDREYSNEVSHITLTINGNDFSITEEFGEIQILSHEGSIMITPCVSNMVTIALKDRT